MTADIQEVQLNLSLKTPASQDNSTDNFFIGPVIPSLRSPSNNTSQVRDNPYIRAAASLISSRDQPGSDQNSPPQTLCNKSSPAKDKSVSPMKRPVSSGEGDSLNEEQAVDSPSKRVPVPVDSPSKRAIAPVNSLTKGASAPVNSPSEGAPAPVNSPSKGAPAAKRPARDITKSRRYQSSLSFLLGSMTEEDIGHQSANRQESKDTNTSDRNKETVPMDCSQNVTVPVLGVCQSTIPPIDSCQTYKENTATQNGTVSAPECAQKQTETKPAPPTLHHSKRPCPYKFRQPTLAKTTSKLFTATSNNYLKGCKWSPDGLALLTCSRDKIVRIFNIPDIASAAEQHPSAQHCTASVPYDMAWNPEIDHLTAKNCNLAVSCKDSPVQILNAFSGATQASFTAFNNVEVLISAFSVCYLSRDKLLAGYCKHVRVFDVTRPGRECTVASVGDLQHQNNNSIVSTVARHPTTHGLFGAGCYNSTVGLYSTQIPGVLLPFYGPQHGVTQILFSNDGNRLYCGSRMEGEIYCFDTRYNGSVLGSYKRDVQTNQRIQFDLNTSETLLVTGNHDGSVLLFDLTREQSLSNQDRDVTSCDKLVGNESGESDSCELRFEAHKDTVNGVSFHPYWGLLATASGRRHFHIEDSETEENSLKIWSF